MASSPHYSDSVGPEALARRSGVCKMCDESIVAGEHYVCKTKTRGWVHAQGCSDRYRELREIVDANREDES